MFDDPGMSLIFLLNSVLKVKEYIRVCCIGSLHCLVSLFIPVSNSLAVVGNRYADLSFTVTDWKALCNVLCCVHCCFCGEKEVVIT